MNLREKVALVYVRKQNLSARTSWRTTVLFLAFLILGFIGQRAGAQEQPAANYALVIEVYAGVVEPSYEKNFSLELEKLYKGVQPDAAWLPKVIHIDHALLDKEFDVAAQGETNGHKIVAQAHVSRQADGNYKITFSQLGPPPPFSEATELTVGLDKRQILPLPAHTQPDGQGNLVTVAVIWTPAVIKDQNGHSRFEVQ